MESDYSFRKLSKEYFPSKSFHNFELSKHKSKNKRIENPQEKILYFQINDLS